jgi:hypothetical protein
LRLDLKVERDSRGRADVKDHTVLIR